MTITIACSVPAGFLPAPFSRVTGEARAISGLPGTVFAPACLSWSWLQCPKRWDSAAFRAPHLRCMLCLEIMCMQDESASYFHRTGHGERLPLVAVRQGRGGGLGTHRASSWLGSGGDHAERIVPSRMGFMCFAEEKPCHPGWSCKVFELVEMNMMVAGAQSPGQGESPFGSSPHTGHWAWQTTALLSILLVSRGRVLSLPFPPSRCTHFFAPMYSYTFEVVYLS